MQLVPYLNFNGDCEAAFKFYEVCFKGKIVVMMVHAGTPAQDYVPAEWQNKIMHARLEVGGTVLMGSDTTPDSYVKPVGMNVSIHIDTVAEAERVFHALAQNGTMLMPIEKTFWAARFGMVEDQFGIPWMINCEADKTA